MFIFIELSICIQWTPDVVDIKNLTFIAMSLIDNRLLKENKKNIFKD